MCIILKMGENSHQSKIRKILHKVREFIFNNSNFPIGGFLLEFHSFQLRKVGVHGLDRTTLCYILAQAQPCFQFPPQAPNGPFMSSPRPPIQ